MNEEPLEIVAVVAKGPKGAKGDQGEPGESMTPGARRAIAVLLLIVLALAGAGLFWTSYEVRQSQHRWCSILVTLDHADQAALKAPPSQRPHGAYAFALINDFHHLRGQFGCG